MNTDFTKVVCIQVFCYVFIGMYLRMLLCFHWNVFNINIQMYLILIYKCCLIIL